MSFVVPALPYAKDALAPHLSPETLEFHYEKHHKAYAAKLNDLTKDSPLAKQSLEEIIKTAPAGPIFNNAAQIYNHTFYWNSLTPKSAPVAGVLKDLVDRDFKGFEELKKSITTAATTHFGSGWVFLVLNKDKKLEVQGHHDASCPLKNGDVPLITMDVWEHAYYIDYRNRRPEYIDHWFAIANWAFAEENLKKAL